MGGADGSMPDACIVSRAVICKSVVWVCVNECRGHVVVRCMEQGGDVMRDAWQ